MDLKETLRADASHIYIYGAKNWAAMLDVLGALPIPKKFFVQVVSLSPKWCAKRVFLPSRPA